MGCSLILSTQRVTLQKPTNTQILKCCTIRQGKSSISKASSYEKIGEFWDTHDFTDCLDDSEIVDFDIDIQSSKIYYHIETHLSDEVRSIAKRKGVSPSILLNSWLRERLREESA